MTLDAISVDQSVTITAIDWTLLADGEGRRLRALGIDEGAQIAIAHRGMLGGSDPIAITIGRMTIAIRRAHARAMTVEAA